jgi:hypothetical protein
MTSPRLEGLTCLMNTCTLNPVYGLFLFLRYQGRSLLWGRGEDGYVALPKRVRKRLAGELSDFRPYPKGRILNRGLVDSENFPNTEVLVALYSSLCVE